MGHHLRTEAAGRSRQYLTAPEYAGGDKIFLFAFCARRHNNDLVLHCKQNSHYPLPPTPILRKSIARTKEIDNFLIRYDSALFDRNEHIKFYHPEKPGEYRMTTESAFGTATASANLSERIVHFIRIYLRTNMLSPYIFLYHRIDVKSMS